MSDELPITCRDDKLNPAAVKSDSDPASQISDNNEGMATPRTAQIAALQAELTATQQALAAAQQLVSHKEQEALSATALAQQVRLFGWRHLVSAPPAYPAWSSMQLPGSCVVSNAAPDGMAS